MEKGWIHCDTSPSQPWGTRAIFLSRPTSLCTNSSCKILQGLSTSVTCEVIHDLSGLQQGDLQSFRHHLAVEVRYALEMHHTWKVKIIRWIQPGPCFPEAIVAEIKRLWNLELGLSSHIQVSWEQQSRPRHGTIKPSIIAAECVQWFHFGPQTGQKFNARREDRQTHGI